LEANVSAKAGRYFLTRLGPKKKANNNIIVAILTPQKPKHKTLYGEKRMGVSGWEEGDF
jgi:hypothetical protein